MAFLMSWYHIFIIIVLVSYSYEREPAEDLFTDANIMLQCNTITKLSRFSPIGVNLNIHAKRITISECDVPPQTYAKALSAININPAEVVELTLVFRVHEKLPASSFQNLTLQTLNLIWLDPYTPLVDINRQVVDMDIFTVVPTIENFTLYGGILPKLPATQLKTVSLEKGASVEEWGDCKELKRLTLVDWEVPDVPEWVANCSQLSSLELKQLKDSSMQYVLSGVKTLNELRINNCELELLSETLLAESISLSKLDLSDNSLTHIHRNAFSRLIRLQELSMPDNKLRDARELIYALLPLKRLRKLDLDRNVRLNFCVDPDLHSMPIQQISLRQTSLANLCFGSWRKLKILNAFETLVESLQWNKSMLPRPKGHDLLVDLRSCPLVKWPTKMLQSDIMIKTYKKAKNITVLVSLSVECNRDGTPLFEDWFNRTLRSLHNLEIKGAVCSDGKPHNEPSQLKHILWLEHDKSLCEGCICRRSWRDNSTEMDCMGRSLGAVPNLQNITNLRSFQGARNYITTLPDSLPDTLLKVNLSDNNINRLSAEAVAALFSIRARIVTLAQNPIMCTCDNQPMIAALHKHRDQVSDFNDLTCNLNVKSVHAIDPKTLCPTESKEKEDFDVRGAFLMVAIVTAVLCCKYWKQFKVFAYNRDWYPRCLIDEELKEEWIFDAFISFADDDELPITEELLPVLDREYVLCVHTRNWVPDELVSTQVAQSVLHSRRTVIMLSANFVRSEWGLLQFYTAHTVSMGQERECVIVVLMDDDIDVETLPEDLRWYLKSKTYLKWGEPWFWEKMRYAMPHKPNRPPENPLLPIPYENLILPQNETATHRNDLENHQPTSDLQNLPV